MSSPVASSSAERFGTDELPLALPRCERGIGRVILQPDSAHLIAGVAVQPVAVWPDDRGYFQEIVRGGQGFVSEYRWERTQVSAAVSWAGTIKAFHFHTEQTDCWAVVTGLLQVALVDLRVNSSSYGRKNTMYIGPLRPWQVRIPAGVAHGYKVVGSESAVLVYATDQLYNPADEGRISYDHPALNYDWETQHK